MTWKVCLVAHSLSSNIHNEFLHLNWL